MLSLWSQCHHAVTPKGPPSHGPGTPAAPPSNLRTCVPLLHLSHPDHLALPTLITTKSSRSSASAKEGATHCLVKGGGGGGGGGHPA